MRNLFALLFVAAAFTFASCGNNEQKTENADTTKVDTVAADPQPQVVDTTAAKMDSSAAKTDSTAKK